LNAHTRDALVDLLVRRLDGVMFAEELIDWATAALAEGLDTPALAILAGLARNSSLYEAEQWFPKVLNELQVNLTHPDTLRRAYVGAVSRALLAGKVGYQEALDRVHRHAVNPLGHPADLASWCFVWEGLHPEDYSDLSPDDTDRAARVLAQQWSDYPAGLAPG
jgi:hypothetical protein